MIVFGLIVCLLGFKLISFIVGGLIFGTIGISTFMFIVFIVFGQEVTGTKLFVGILVSIVAGLEGAYVLTQKVKDNALGIIASWGLISLGFLLLPLAIPAKQKYNNLKLVIYTLLGLVGYYLAKRSADSIQIYITAFTGAYTCIRGISLYAGGFIDEINWTIDPETVANIENSVQKAVNEVQDIDEEDINEENLELMKSQMWITPEIQVFLGYILAILILFQIGVLHQKKMLKR